MTASEASTDPRMAVTVAIDGLAEEDSVGVDPVDVQGMDSEETAGTDRKEKARMDGNEKADMDGKEKAGMTPSLATTTARGLLATITDPRDGITSTSLDLHLGRRVIVGIPGIGLPSFFHVLLIISSFSCRSASTVSSGGQTLVDRSNKVAT